MKETELRKIFFIIQNSYQGFDYDDTKVAIWLDLLRDVPFELAQQNLRNHIKTSHFPPTIAEIRGTVQETSDRHIPSVAETKRMLEALRSIEPTGPTPEQRERVMQSVGRRSV